MSQAKAKIIQFRVTEQDYANLMPISHTQPRRSTNEWIIKNIFAEEMQKAMLRMVRGRCQ